MSFVRVAPLAENGALRSFLARFLFVGEDVFNLVKNLWGGEKGRLALAKLIYSNKNVLVLDEPTNHLDIPSREALEAALDAYPGTILTVSHDRFFLDKVATQIFSFEEDGKVEVFDGNYSEFHDWKASFVIRPSSLDLSASEAQMENVNDNEDAENLHGSCGWNPRYGRARRTGNRRFRRLRHRARRETVCRHKC